MFSLTFSAGIRYTSKWATNCDLLAKIIFNLTFPIRFKDVCSLGPAPFPNKVMFSSIEYEYSYEIVIPLIVNIVKKEGILELQINIYTLQVCNKKLYNSLQACH